MDSVPCGLFIPGTVGVRCGSRFAVTLVSASCCRAIGPVAGTCARSIPIVAVRFGSRGRAWRFGIVGGRGRVLWLRALHSVVTT